MNLQSNVTSDAAWRSAAAQAGAMLALPEPGTSPIRARGLREVPPAIMPVVVPVQPDVAARQDIPIEELSFCELKTHEEIAAIKHLREEIHIPESALADPEFHAREKKETNMAWWAPLPAATRSSGRFASYP